MTDQTTSRPDIDHSQEVDESMNTSSDESIDDAGRRTRPTPMTGSIPVTRPARMTRPTPTPTPTPLSREVDRADG